MKVRGLPLLTLALASLASPSTGVAQATPVGVVAQLYRDFAWEAVMDEPEWRGHSLMEQPQTVLARYFDDGLIALLLADRACVSRTHEECRLDHLPIWDSQDPGATQLKVLGTPDSSVVRVSFRYPSDRTPIELAYHMVRTGRGWRIHDIVSRSAGSLRQQLSAP